MFGLGAPPCVALSHQAGRDGGRKEEKNGQSSVGVLGGEDGRRGRDERNVRLKGGGRRVKKRRTYLGNSFFFSVDVGGRSISLCRGQASDVHGRRRRRRRRERERERRSGHTGGGAITLGIEVESWRDVMTLLRLKIVQVGGDGADYETYYECQ